MWDVVAKAMVEGQEIALSAYIIKEEMSEINNLSFHLQKPEKR